MPEAIKGFAARFYAFATKRVSLLRDFQRKVADDVLKEVESGTVLDVGTGPGHLLIEIASGNPSLEVVGLDVSRDMVRIARTNASGADAEKVELLLGDVAEIGMRNESVDLAVATLSFHHWANPDKAFEELPRVLKGGAEVWIYEVNSDLTPQSEDWMKKNHDIITRKIAPLVIRMLGGHSITVEHAKEILRCQKSIFARSEVEQLEPLLIKMTLTKK
jgi:ubiquinone/menaquinone biosynthesis C-methylase UbiE